MIPVELRINALLHPVVLAHGVSFRFGMYS